jgi:glycosyltransferase involved in cell wall biosynthesis
MLTVIFATRNGIRTLPTVLDGYLRIQPPKGGWKLIVVDNGSTDESVKLIDSYRDRLPLTRLSEKKPGKNAALNTALAHIDGDLVVLTDDDAVPHAGWLIALRAAADGEPAYSIFGGVVRPRWEIAPPEWILKWVSLSPAFTVTPTSLAEGPMDPNHVFGPNMAVRANVFTAGFRFDESIGPRGANYAMGSETEFVRRLAKHGFAPWHVRGAVVDHMIRRFQMQKSWVLRRAVRFGRGSYRMRQIEGRVNMPTWVGVPRYLVREIIRQSLLLGKSALTLHGESAFRARWELNVVRGEIIEAYTHRSSRDDTAPQHRVRSVA